MIRKCDNCGKLYDADSRNLKRGWGLCCSKSCAASKREKSKPGYNRETVTRNNIKRVTRSAGKVRKPRANVQEQTQRSEPDLPDIPDWRDDSSFENIEMYPDFDAEY